MIITTLLAAVLIVAAVYAAAVVLVALRFRRCCVTHDRDAKVGGELGVSILVPLEGAEPGLLENLAAYCQLDHRGAVQIVVGSLDPQDPALATARAAAARHPAAEIAIVAGAKSLGPNRKASLLVALAATARHPIIAAVDSDVRVPRDYLSRMLPALLRPGVGLVSCVYRAPSRRTLAQAYEALCVNTDFCPSVVLASALGRRDLALGASIVLRKSTLQRVGGFAALVDYLADDHHLAEVVNAIGQSVTLAPCVVDSDPNPATVVAALRHQLRWARTVRACAPWGYCASILTHGVTFAVVALALGPRLPHWMGTLAALVLMLRIAAAIAGTWALGARIDATLVLLPLRDLVATAIWCTSFAGNRVEWRGRHFRLGPEGHLRPDDARAGRSDVATTAGASAVLRSPSESRTPRPNPSWRGQIAS
jgi:ceramide glucosyltransferase